tara:strand:- start:304 stop:714 length:411 start_codon:yes stop_codon:yes gene_type:complete
MSQLFEIKPESREVKFDLYTYRNNRIVSKLMRLLKDDGIYKITKKHSTPESVIFGVSIISDKKLGYVYSDLKKEIISYIPDHFPANYQFDFNGEKLGFTKSFRVYGMDGIFLDISHRIKEINKKSLMPDVQIFDNI